jgi:hypothetical protein
MVRDRGHIIWFDIRVGRLVPVLRVHGFEGQGARDLGLLCLALPYETHTPHDGGRRRGR